MTDKDRKNLVEFGLRLKSARESAGMTQSELGNVIGTSKSVISQYESGQNDPRQSAIPLLAEALNVSINWLMGVDEFDNIQIAANTGDSFDDLPEDDQERIRSFIRKIRQLREDEIDL